jgi:acetyl/propionyl-CoA carboxylase alpha subunit
MKKVLIANRGEIARRVIRTLRKMNIKSVAIYSDADANAPHVLEADESVYVGKSPSSESYLQQDLILKHCKDLNVDGIHPGYGFLSENADFAERVEKSGFTFIGPTPESIRMMGDKVSAKQAMIKAGVPVTPGTEGNVADIAEALTEGDRIGRHREGGGRGRWRCGGGGRCECGNRGRERR